MRIALYHNLPSGGAKRAINELVRQMQPCHTIDVYTPSCANHDFADLRPHVDNHFTYPFQPRPLLASPFGRVNQLMRISDLYRIRKPQRAIARDIESRHYDLVFIHPCQIEIAPSLIRLIRRTPTIYFCQEPLRRAYEPMPARPYDTGGSRRRKLLDAIDPLPRLYLATLKRIDRRNTRKAHTVLVNSHFVQRAIQKHYNLQAGVCYLGVDPEHFFPLERPRRPMILSVGSLTPLKGFDFLIEAVAQLPPDVRVPLFIASNFQNPPERQYLQWLADHHGVDLHLLENISDQRLCELYNEAQVVAYAAIREPFGLVPVEAMACATPVVAVREGGVQESILDGETGFLTERHPATFASALSQLLSDPARARTIGEQGRRHVERNWTWKQAGAQLEEIFKTVVNIAPDNNAVSGTIAAAQG